MRYGHFDNENREYVIERPDVPVSWTNYLGIKDLCTVISHNAGGYSFYRNAEHQRITRFRANGVPLDRPGHYVYLRDDETGDYWSISWQPGYPFGGKIVETDTCCGLGTQIDEVDAPICQPKSMEDASWDPVITAFERGYSNADLLLRLLQA